MLNKIPVLVPIKPHRSEVMKEHIAKPYWYVDLKWISAILLTLSLTVTLALFVLSKLTTEQSAVEISTLAIATVFSREEGGLDDTASIEKLKAETKKQAGTVIHPLPNIPAISISKQDLTTLSPREVRLKIFRQVTEPLYNEGVEGVAQRFTSDQNQQQQFMRQASLLRFFTRGTHDMINRFWLVGMAVSIVFLVSLIFFSFGWGRLANPGLIFCIVGLPGSFVALLLLHPPAGGGGPASAVPPEIAQAIGQQFQGSYQIVLGAGLMMLLVALIGKIITAVRHNHQSTSQR